MLKENLKHFLIGVARGRTLPVFSGPLFGMRLRFTGLIKGRNYFQRYEPDKQMAFDLLLKPGNIFFDIGSNIGLHSYYIAKQHPGVKIFAFEPLPENFDYIKETVERNGLSNIQVIKKAVSSESGDSYFDASDNNSTGMLSNEKTGLLVRTISLDDYVTETQNFPDLIKIDVEGAESLVLEGAKQLAKDKSPIFVIELHNPRQDIKVSELLTKFNYTIFRLNSSSNLNLSELLTKVKNIGASWPDPNGVWGSIVAIKTDRLGNTFSFRDK